MDTLIIIIALVAMYIIVTKESKEDAKVCNSCKDDCSNCTKFNY